MAEPVRTCHSDVLVIGAGPAGIAAACAAAESGRSVAVLDDNPAAGGQIWRGGPDASAVEAAPWFERLARCGAVVHAATAVSDVVPRDGGPPTILVRSPEGLRAWHARGIVIATGARERFLPFPGWTLPGVVGAGGLQALVKQGLDVRGRRIVVAGTGPLLLAVAELLAATGATVVAVAEQASLGRLARFAVGLVAHPAKLVQAVGIRRAIGPVLRTGSFPVAVRPADGGGLVVTLASGRPGRERRRDLACDILACGFGLVPNLEVARAVGCETHRAAIAIDDVGATTVPGVWAAGECTGVGGLDKSLVEGRIAGLAAAGGVEEARRLLPAAGRWRRFAAALERTFALDRRLARLASDDTVVCRCEDVAAGRLRCHRSWREAKLMTRIGMGPCQGRVCGPAAGALFGWSPDDIRPPLAEIPLADLA
jgi:NADPH-dependent 2,4-dienoyl-CoA reductase/sulfur reductase-like enzyme